MKDTRKTRFTAARCCRRQQGASLLEGIAYLGIAAMVILGAVSLLSSAFSSAQTNRAAEEIVSIRTAVKKLYMGQTATYGVGLLTTDLQKANALPSSLVVTEAGGVVTLKNSWDGAVKITGNNALFAVEYDGVPQDVCINLLTTSNGWEQVAIGAGGTAITPLPITPAAATGQCLGATNVIEWTSN